MNIWILHQEANIPQENGPTRHIDMAKALSEHGCQVTLIFSDFSHTSKKVRNTTYFECDSVELLMLPTPSYTRNNWKRLYAMLVFSLRAMCLRLKGKPKPDFIIGSSPSPFTALAAFFLSKRFNAKYIYEIRDLWPETLVKLGGIKPFHPLVLLLYGIEKFLAERADLIIGVLPGIPDYLSKYHVQKDKILYFPNFSHFTEPPVFDKHSPSSPNTFTVLYAGAHGLANALDTLVDAADILQKNGYNDIKFQLIGDGLHKQTLMNKAKSLGLNNISFLNPVPKADIYFHIAQSDACTILWQDSELYQWGTCANKIFDYMVMRKPIITASNSPYARATCGPVVPANNPQAFADGVLQLYQLPKPQYSSLCDASFDYGRTHHDITHLTSSLIGRMYALETP